MKNLTLFYLLIIIMPAYSQVAGSNLQSDEYTPESFRNVKISLSDKQLKKLEKISTPAVKLNKYRKFYKKDSLKALKKFEKLVQQKADSLFKVHNKKLNLEKYALDSTELKSTGIGLIKENANNPIANLEEYEHLGLILDKNPELSKWLATYGNDPTMLSKLPDSVLNTANIEEKVTGFAQNKVAGLSEFQELEKSAREFIDPKDFRDEYKSLGEDYFEQAQQFTDPEGVKQEANIQLAQYTRKFLQKHSDILKGVDSQIQKAKKKYASIADPTDLNTAVKRNSLSGRPIGERIVLGGNFDLKLGEPILLDISPLIGFRFDKRFSMGVGATYRGSYSIDESTFSPTNESKVYGFNSFMRYDIIQKFFLTGQYDYLNGMVRDNSMDDEKPVWRQGVVVGVGRQFNIHPKLNGTIVLLYSMLNNHVKNPSGNRLQIRLGIQTNELTFKKVNRPY